MARQRTMRSFLRDEGGAAALWIAGTFPIMVMAAGLAIDLGEAYLVRTRLAHALDAAGLAMGAAPMDTSEDRLREIGQEYLEQNFGDTSMLDGPLVLVPEISPDRQTISVSATASVKNSFMKIVHASSTAVAAASEIKREVKGLEVAMILDNTGSMWSNGNIGAVRESAKILVNTLFGGTLIHPNLKIGLVPYSVAVNVSSIADAVVDDADETPELDADTPKTDGWKGCVIERTPPHDVQDSSVETGGRWTKYWWPSSIDNKWTPDTTVPIKNKKGKIIGYETVPGDIETDTAKYDNAVHSPNIGCPTPILPLSNDKNEVLEHVDAMTAWNRGGTISSVGMSWGLRMLSPEAPLTEGVAWDNVEWQKAAILMTDGDNLLYDLTGNAGPNKPDTTTASDWSAYGRIDSSFAQTVFKTKNLNTVKDKLNGKLTEVCTAMKAKGITVYTIVFTSGISSATKDVYRLCASAPKNYFYAPGQNELRAAFSAIANELSQLRISR